MKQHQKKLRGGGGVAPVGRPPSFYESPGRSDAEMTWEGEKRPAGSRPPLDQAKGLRLWGLTQWSS